MGIDAYAQLVEIVTDGSLCLIIAFDEDIGAFPVLLPGCFMSCKQRFIQRVICLWLISMPTRTYHLAMMLKCGQDRISRIPRGIHHDDLFGSDRFSRSQFPLQFNTRCGIRIKYPSPETGSWGGEAHRLQ